MNQSQGKNSATERTKYHLVKGIKEVMVEKSLDHITVSDIVSHSNLTRQTFYRHFKDKFHLVNWYFDKEALKTIRQMGKSCSLEEALSGKFQCMVNNKVFFMSAFKASGCNSLIEYDTDLIYNFYKNMIVNTNKDLYTEEIDFLLKLYSSGAVAMIVTWSQSGMELNPEMFAKRMIDGFPPKVESLIRMSLNKPMHQKDVTV